MSAVDAIAVSPRAPNRAKQLRLFTVPNPLVERLGTSFFRSLPRCPGVYFFHDHTGRLLYIGQSNNLRARIGSYRHVCFERHPRRTLRLVHQVRRIEWQPCDSPEAAIERERELLLTLRPPFNRAGVWQGTPWWLRLEQSNGTLRFWLKREDTPAVHGDETSPSAALALINLAEADMPAPESDVHCFGPYRAEFPFVYSALVRTVLRACRPGIKHSDFPAGWMDARRLAESRLQAGAAVASLAERIGAFLEGQHDGLIPEDEAHIADTADELTVEYLSVEEQLLQQDMETLRDFFTRRTTNLQTPLKA